MWVSLGYAEAIPAHTGSTSSADLLARSVAGLAETLQPLHCLTLWMLHVPRGKSLYHVLIKYLTLSLSLLSLYLCSELPLMFPGQ